MNEKILIIDDEAEILAILVDLLEDEGYVTMQAGDGAEGLELFQQGNPDLVITDMRMPKKSGLEVLKAIKGFGVEVDVIVLTGQSDEATAIDCLRAGAYDYLLKPIEDLDLLLTAISRALQKRHLEQENKLLIKKLEEMTVRDPLTGLYNVRQLYPSLDEEISRSERFNHSFCLLFIDIDHFKKINDNYGHPFGDYVLKKLGNVMGSVLRAPCKLFRYGGEEFIILMPETGHADAITTIERLMRAVKEQHFRYDAQATYITISIGVTFYPEHSTGKSEIIKLADQALYRAKEAGRDRYVVTGE